MGAFDVPVRGRAMFEAGRVYKVKVELAPGQSGFGRATVLEKTNHQICIQFKTSRESNKLLPKGTRIWFVNDSVQGPSTGSGLRL